MLVLAPWPDFCEGGYLLMTSCASLETPAISGLPQEASPGPQEMRISKNTWHPHPTITLRLAQQCMKFSL